MRESADSWRARTAFHEAGHTVVARELRIGVRAVTIVPDEHSSGHWDSYRSGPLDFDSARGRDRVQRLIGVGYAGVLAEQQAVQLWRHGGAAEFLPPEHHSDLQFVVNVSREMMASERTAQAYSYLIKMRTLDLIERPVVWSQITAVACALWEHGELTGRRFHAICRGIERQAG